MGTYPHWPLKQSQWSWKLLAGTVTLLNGQTLSDVYLAPRSVSPGVGQRSRYPKQKWLCSVKRWAKVRGENHTGHAPIPQTPKGHLRRLHQGRGCGPVPHKPSPPPQPPPATKAITGPVCVNGTEQWWVPLLSDGGKEEVSPFPEMSTWILKCSPEEYGTCILIIFLFHVSSVLGLRMMSSFSILLFQPYSHGWSLEAYSSVLLKDRVTGG